MKRWKWLRAADFEITTRFHLHIPGQWLIMILLWIVMTH